MSTIKKLIRKVTGKKDKPAETTTARGAKMRKLTAEEVAAIQSNMAMGGGAGPRRMPFTPFGGGLGGDRDRDLLS